MAKEDYITGDGHQIDFYKILEADGYITRNEDALKYWTYNYDTVSFNLTHLAFYERIGYDYVTAEENRFAEGNSRWARKSIFLDKLNCMKNMVKLLDDDSKNYEDKIDKCLRDSQKILQQIRDDGLEQ